MIAIFDLVILASYCFKWAEANTATRLARFRASIREEAPRQGRTGSVDVEGYLAVPYATRRNANGYGDLRGGFGVQRFVSFPYPIYSREHRLLRVGVLKTAVARVLPVAAEAEVFWDLRGMPRVRIEVENMDGWSNWSANCQRVRWRILWAINAV